jgi:hypothetical protein
MQPCLRVPPAQATQRGQKQEQVAEGARERHHDVVS